MIKEKLWDVIKYEKSEPVTTAWSQKDDEARAAIGLLVEDNYNPFGMRKVHAMHGMLVKTVTKRQL